MSYINEIFEEPSDPLGGTSGAKRRFNVQFLAKSDNPDFPFSIANEVVATHLGICLGLHLPNVLVYRIGGQSLVFVQMIGRDPEMMKGPPATSRALHQYVQDHGQEVHGAVIFDLFVANNDRAFGPVRRNLMIDQDNRLLLYDQGNACYYRNRPAVGINAGIPRLDAVEKDLRAMFDMSHKANHYFEFLEDWRLVEFWCDRIRQLPDYLIENIVARIPAYLDRPNGAERSRLIEFLIARKSYLLDHIIGCAGLFPRLPERGDHA